MSAPPDPAPSTPTSASHGGPTEAALARSGSHPTGPGGFVPPPYPYDRLDPLRRRADNLPGGVIDLSIGTPTDPAPDVITDALAAAPVRGYPPSVGTETLRTAAARWIDRRFGASLDPATQIAATIGSKELVAGIPHWLRLRDPSRDTVLHPAISYPSYAMGATLAGCRAVAVPMTGAGTIDLAAIDDVDARRALCLWVNTPGNPAGGLDDLAAVAAWGADRDVVVCSDECYAELTWQGPPRSVLSHTSSGVLAVHSLSKRSNAAGLRVGFYAGDAELVGYLSEVRKHAGFMCPSPSQAAGAAALEDDDHVSVQRQRYRARLESLIEVLGAIGVESTMPGGGFYLFPSDVAGGWALAERIADELGALVSPGELYGEVASQHVRIAAVGDDERHELLRRRAGLGPTPAGQAPSAPRA